jgi:hypothetical protein
VQFQLTERTASKTQPRQLVTSIKDILQEDVQVLCPILLFLAAAVVVILPYHPGGRR